MRELLQCMLRTSFLAKTIDEQKEADHRFFFCEIQVDWRWEAGDSRLPSEKRRCNKYERNTKKTRIK